MPIYHNIAGIIGSGFLNKPPILKFNPLANPIHILHWGLIHTGDPYATLCYNQYLLYINLFMASSDAFAQGLLLI